MTAEERQELIDRYAGSFEALQIALFHIGDHGLDEAPEGEWTPRQIVHHLADAEVIRSARLRSLLAGSAARMPVFDEQAFAANIDYSRPLDASLAVLRAATAANLELLGAVAEGGWQRQGGFDTGEVHTLEDWLRRAAEHCHEHVSQLESYAVWHTEGVHSN